MYQSMSIGVVIPARNEQPAITEVVRGLLELRDCHNAQVIDHVVVCDNGSTDGTGQLASAAGASVVYEPRAGYGQACLTAVAAMPSVDVLLFVDGDRSVHSEQCLRLLQAIKDGADLVIGARNLGQVESGAMTVTQRFGNAFALLLVRLLWRFRFHDLGPFRAIRTRVYQSIKMQDPAFGWTMEMQLKAMQAGAHIVEVPVDTRARLGHSKISGTVRGVIGAGCGILGMVWTLWRRERHNRAEKLTA
jgi:glycosyltransferase involved in cell wall biosynthesis